ncbi:MarR family winged helix-turn-helix transcriptional regulator [Clostridium chromiireducens]|uniref:MarR family transcriptional regulator n=1 Tax=Clostridium chromiireducens TaxID=225345 RepID=A0A399ITW6_9CLOT|nr:MarR family transcriptional regulator [Clostridium chromiireducens]RII35977.1 MarR family transcriptional regulator [Clostridium chromiireducens]
MNRQEESLSPNNELVQEQADEILGIFKSIKRSLSCKYEKIAKEYGFTAPQLGVIFHLYMVPSITLNELSDYMSLTKSTVSGIVDRLAKQGVVNREIPKDNRRIVKLSISEEFKKNNDIFAIKKRFFDEFILNSIKEMDPEEVDKIIYGLRQLSVLLKDDN